MSLLKSLKHVFENFGKTEIPRDDRCLAAGLVASIVLDSTTIPVDIGNISISGIYLIIEKQLTIGDTISLTLRKKGEPENTELQLSIEVRVIDRQEGGFGLAFVVPPGMKAELWTLLMRNLVQLSEKDEVADAFRVLHTIQFLCTLCPFECDEVIQLIFGGQLDSDRTVTLFKVAHAAETSLAQGADSKRLRAHPKLLAHILREASWATDELNISLWAGLLVSSCSADAPDESNEVFANLLVHLTPTEARIFIRACEQALAAAPVAGTAADALESPMLATVAATPVCEAPTPASETSAAERDFSASSSEASKPAPKTPMNAPGPPASRSSDHDSVPIVFTPKEMIEATGIYDLYRNATDLAYLFNLGLVRKVFDFTSYHDADSFDVTPSALGLELYKHCHGHRGAVDPQHVDAANAHLANFIPTPHLLPPDKDNLTPLPTYTPE